MEEFKRERIGASLLDSASESSDLDDLKEQILSGDWDATERLCELVEQLSCVVEELISECEKCNNNKQAGEVWDLFQAIIKAIDRADAWSHYGDLMLLEHFAGLLVDPNDDGAWPLSQILCAWEEDSPDELYSILSTRRFCLLSELLANLHLCGLLGINFTNGDILYKVLIDNCQQLEFFDGWDADTFEQLQEFICDAKQIDSLKKLLPSEILSLWDTKAANMKKAQEQGELLLQKLEQWEQITRELQRTKLDFPDLFDQAMNNERLRCLVQQQKQAIDALNISTSTNASLHVFTPQHKNPIYGHQSVSELKIASWNVENLGFNSKTKREFTATIAKLECDILAIQELRAPPYKGTYSSGGCYNPSEEAKKFFDCMHAKGFLSTFPCDSTGNRENNNNRSTSEFMPVFFNPQKVSLLDCSYISNANSIILKLDADGYAYAPTVYEFAVVGTTFKFCLIVVHLCPDVSQIAQDKRMQDIKLVGAWISSKGVPAIVVGDMNAKDQEEAKLLPQYLSETAKKKYVSVNERHTLTSKGAEYDFILSPVDIVCNGCKVEPVPSSVSNHYIIQGSFIIKQ